MTTTTKSRPASEHRGYGSDDERWQALVQRDNEADGQFYYSVKTTGVYCRPSCASRLPRRENVTFYSSCEDASKAGFRPCKRCNPDGSPLAERHAAVVARACRAIQTSDESPNLKTLAESAGLSPFHFHRLFTKTVGLTPKAYAAAHRAERIRKTLPGRRTVTEAIYEAGFNSNSRFYAKSSGMLGMRPNHFRNGGTGTTIRFAVGECSLGSILVAASEKGVCAILLGDDSAQLARDLQDSFPRANLIGGDRDFERLVSQVVGIVENPRLGVSLPLDIQGTAFQQRVWLALQKIPPGKTVSYSEIADRIGLPKAARAVASACAANTIAVVIPCHRVVRTDGSLSGYRWGVERKRALLKRE